MTAPTTPPSMGIQAQLQLQRPGFALSLTLDLPGHGVTALLGPSGCGKTTVLRALAGLERAQGRVCVQGQIWQDDAQGLWLPTHQRALGYVFQEASLLEHLSVADNLHYALRRVPKQRPADQRIAIDHAVELLGIGHLMGRPSTALSGGERQRVAIARALACSPRLLLLDEPLAALDSGRKAEVLPYLEALQHNLRIPVVYVSHAPDEVLRLAHHMVLMEAGGTIASGPTDAVLARIDTPLATSDHAATLLTGTVVAHDASDHIMAVQCAGGLLHLVCAHPRSIGSTVRLRVQARDVSLARQAPVGSSILNTLPATVTGLASAGPGLALVALDAGGSALLARITQRSAHALALVPGCPVWAQVKGVAVLG